MTSFCEVPEWTNMSSALHDVAGKSSFPWCLATEDDIMGHWTANAVSLRNKKTLRSVISKSWKINNSTVLNVENMITKKNYITMNYWKEHHYQSCSNFWRTFLIGVEWAVLISIHYLRLNHFKTYISVKFCLERSLRRATYHLIGSIYRCRRKKERLWKS